MAAHAGHDDHAAHRSADDQYLETPPGAGYEHTDATGGPLVKFAFWLVVAVVAVHFGLGGMYKFFISQASEPAETQKYPLDVSAPMRMPAAPRLQQKPEVDMFEFRAKENAQLHAYGWVDKDAGTVHIPIDEAMRLMLERGMPVRETPPGAAADPSAGMMPSDSSSGRVLERRRQ